MMENKTVKYYRIIPLNQIGRKTESGYELYRNGQWEQDREYLISDRLMGYDPSEPPGSPYGIGNTEIMREIEEMTAEEAEKYIR